jgi:hypothetical protein
VIAFDAVLTWPAASVAVAVIVCWNGWSATFVDVDVSDVVHPATVVTVVVNASVCPPRVTRYDARASSGSHHVTLIVVVAELVVVPFAGVIVMRGGNNAAVVVVNWRDRNAVFNAPT